jgi:hypothetical protein
MAFRRIFVAPSSDEALQGETCIVLTEVHAGLIAFVIPIRQLLGIDVAGCENGTVH